MKNIHNKTLEDLEFNAVISLIVGHCTTHLGKTIAKEISPITDEAQLYDTLAKTDEYLSSFFNENKLPNHGFESITDEIRLLKIENSCLEIDHFRKISALSQTAISILKFLKKFKEYYPNLYQQASTIEVSLDIEKHISSIIDRFGDIKPSASKELAEIRVSINSVKEKINKSFNSALSHYNSQGYLDDIKESVIENKRVLAVTAMHRKKVKGSILGHSKTGSIIYIQPEATLTYARELNNLEFEEQEEIRRILKVLTEVIRPFKMLLLTYQDFLSQFDVLSAKAKFAKEINAVLPDINQNRTLFLRDAIHPLLYLSNKKQGLSTYPQTIKLNDDNRILVISGPNAGGKSITLKTVGLLQLMLQSGMLVPVHEGSTFCLFHNVLSDIGDNQSIENHLSTYSYRLKQMNYFLRKCDKDSLFLIDEFGTGSDPELGGALAETFLEEFYKRGAFGIITTHYSNLKVLANELPNMQNANMEFNSKSLEPTFKLELGQPGSSFTFEVAQKNGIPYSLINKSKKKIERGKVRFDATIAKLQKERHKLNKTKENLEKINQKKQDQTQTLEGINDKIQKKLESYQELYDNNQRLIYLGQKLTDLSEKYMKDNKKRDLLSELFKIVQIENSKREKLSAKEFKQKKEKERTINIEAKKKIAKIRKQKKNNPINEIVKKPKPLLKIGDRVRLEDSRSTGTIDKLEKNKAVVNYGKFTTSVSVDKLELVDSKK